MNHTWQARVVAPVALLLGIWELGYACWRLASLWPVQVMASSVWLVLKSRLAAGGGYDAWWVLPAAFSMGCLIAYLAGMRRNQRTVPARVARGDNHE